MGGSSGTAVVVAARTGPVWQTCGERWSTWLVFFRASAMVRVLRWVTARFRIFSQRTTAHGPHKTTSPSAPIVHSPVGERIVATPSAMEMSPAVRSARCRYGTPASSESTSRQRSRRPNIPWVQPWEGSPRSAASTAPLSVSVGWKGAPVGRPSAARTDTDSPGRAYPVVVVWWWSMAATRHRSVPAAAGHAVRKSTTTCGSAGSAGGVGGGAPVGEQRPVRGVGLQGPRRQHPGRLVCGVGGRGGHGGLEAEAGDGVADQGGVFAGVDLEHHRGAVSGLPHDRVRVGALPEGLGDEPGAQRVPAQFVDLGGGEPGGGGAALDHFGDRVAGHRPVADGAGLVHRREQRPGRVGGLGQAGGAAAVQHRLLLLLYPAGHR